MLIKRVIIDNSPTEEARRTRRRLASLFEEQAIDVVQKDPDLVVSVGGDGTFLRTVNRYLDSEAPFVGVNTGSLGFLQEVNSEHLEEFVQFLADDDYEIHDFPLLETDVVLRSGDVRRVYAFNDVVVERSGTRTIRLQLEIDGYNCGRVLGDGIIIATPAGSTAYVSAAGGSIVHPDAEVYQMVPLNPHDSTIYESIRTSLLLPFDSHITITIEPKRKRSPRLVVDGDEGNFEGLERIRTKISVDRHVKVLRLGNVTFWQKLFSKIIGVEDHHTRRN